MSSTCLKSLGNQQNEFRNTRIIGEPTKLVWVHSVNHGCVFLYSYHQKYLLRQRGQILDELKLSDDEIKNSHVCARLNGYCGGFGSTANLEKEIENFNLSEEGMKHLQDLVKRGKHH